MKYLAEFAAEFVLAGILIVIQLWTKRDVKKKVVEEVAVVKAEVVALKVVATETLVLVNGATLKALTSISELSRRIAGLTHDPSDEQAAVKAEKVLASHAEKSK